MKLYIKNMVCNRCKTVVTAELKRLNIEFKSVELGQIDLTDEPKSNRLAALSSALVEHGFEVIEDKTARIISQIKKSIVHFVHNPGEHGKAIKFSSFLTELMNKDYHHLSRIFSGVEGITIEHYLINQRIERVKELLVYDELSLSEIADQLHYSSVQHLSNQFKKVTGLSPSHFKKIGVLRRKSLDAV